MLQTNIVRIGVRERKLLRIWFVKACMPSNGFGGFGWDGPIIFLKMFLENQNGFSYFYVV